MSRRSRLSASARVQLAMTGVLLASTIALIAVAYLVTAGQLRAATDAALMREAEAFGAALAGAPASEPVDTATRRYLAARTGPTAGVRPILFVRLDDGRTISNSEIRLEDAVEDDDAGLTTVVLDGETYRLLAVPLDAAAGRNGVFYAALADSLAHETATTVALTLAAAGAFALAFGVPLSYWATRRALRPLTVMAADAASISHAEPGGRIRYDGPGDELGSLADSLNAMLERLENAFGDQRRFVADASHELRTPVAVIRGNVELLRSNRLSQEDAEESLAMIESEAVRMVRLLDDLLALAKLEDTGRERFQPLEVRTLVDEVTARARALGEREIVCTGACEVWTEGDPDLLDQALVNLIRNAVGHTEPGGRIVVSCAGDDTHVTVSVTDDGPGIPEADLERIFDRFYRAPGRARENAGGGAGLGLAIARRLIELHGGTLSADNVEPHGARFTVTLPRIAAPDDC